VALRGKTSTENEKKRKKCLKKDDTGRNLKDQGKVNRTPVTYNKDVNMKAKKVLEE
jgi:hypothetical protein